MPLRIPGADVLPSIGVAMPTSRYRSALTAGRCTLPGTPYGSNIGWPT